MRASSLRDEITIQRKLVEAGLPVQAAKQKLSLFGLCSDAISDLPQAAPIHAVFVPGRIEVLGKHTDYAGGDSLLCAVAHGFCFVVAEDDDDVLVVINAQSNEKVELPAGEDFQNSTRLGHWSNYPDTVWRRLQYNLERRIRGGIIAFASDLPEAAGMSSSSALVVGTFLALDAMNHLREKEPFLSRVPSIESLGDYLGCVENGRDYPGMPGTEGVGTTGGSQDQTAILCARSDELQHFSFSPTRFRESVPMPSDHAFVIASSGVTAEKTGAALDLYNRVGSRAAAVVETWNSATGDHATTIGDIVRKPDFDEAAMHSILKTSDGAFSPDSLVRRFNQFNEESMELIPSAVTALANGRLDTFAEVVRRSQQLAESCLENQTPETVSLVELAREEGAVAASAFGAGFGGSVWALVRDSNAADFTSRWASRYRQLFPQPAAQSRFFVERPGPGAFQLNLPE